MKKLAFLLGISLVAFSCAACDDDQGVESGVSGDEIPSRELEVQVNDTKTGAIDVANMADRVQTVNIQGEDLNVIPISDIIQEINQISDDEIDEYLSKYECDYESGTDGMRPTDKMNGNEHKCPVVSCMMAKESYYNVDSMSLTYSDDLLNSSHKNGCYRVKDISKILMFDNGTYTGKKGSSTDGESSSEFDVNTLTSYKISVTGVGDAKEVDIVDLKDKIAKVNIETINEGVTSAEPEFYGLKLSEIVASAGIAESELVNYECAFGKADKDWSTEPVECALIVDSYFNVESNKLLHAKETGLDNDIYYVKGFGKVIMTAKVAD